MPFHPTTDKLPQHSLFIQNTLNQKPLHYFEKSKDQTYKQIYNFYYLLWTEQNLAQFFKDHYMVMKSQPYKGMPCLNTLPLTLRQ